MKPLKRLRTAINTRRSLVLYSILAGVLVAFLLLFRLGTLVPGLSPKEYAASLQPFGWHGIYDDPFYLPIKVLRSICYFIDPSHGALATRLPSAVFGALSVVAFAGIVRMWHGTRIALFAGALFACSAWTLHVSRLGQYDVLYLSGILLLLGSHLCIKRYPHSKVVRYGSFLLWGCLMYIPGMIWFIVANKILLRPQMWQLWRDAALKTKALYSLTVLIWLPLLLIHLTRPHRLVEWIGLPQHFPGVTTLLKQIAGVPVHLFVRGPAYPDVWLGRSPVLDIATLIFCGLGIYYYATHLKASRSRTLAVFAVIGWILVSLGGAVGLSVLVPLALLAASTGMAYLLHDWLHVFPNNPVARRFGVAMIALLVVASCSYNLRAYFIAWPHATDTRNTFRIVQ